uniref:Kinesin-like protein n=1 Tax=Syphacia muris TaxID=451379 RepID=A0A158R599_9BILA
MNATISQAASSSSSLASVDFREGLESFRKCTCSHQIDNKCDRIRESILETHLKVKNQLIQNLEDIIDEQEARIRNMNDYISGEVSALSPRNKKILKGISVLSLDFGSLSEENLTLKRSLLNAERYIRMLELQLLPCKPLPINVDAEVQTDELELTSKEIDDRNNNIEKLKDQETAMALRRGLQGFHSAKTDLKRLAEDTRRLIAEEVQCFSDQIQNAVANTVAHFTVRYQQEVEARRRLHNRLVELLGNIRVFCRIRPLNSNEKQQRVMIKSDSLDPSVITAQTSSGEKKFVCDKVFNETHSQDDVFEEVGPIITSCMDGYNVCIFAYGHTGSGKTYTMQGPPENPGINQRSLEKLFKSCAEKSEDYEWTVSISVLEIYNEKIRDLLSKSKDPLCIRVQSSGALDIPGLTSVEVNNMADVNKVLTKGSLNRVTAATEMNDHSSRSHAVVRVTIKSVNRSTKAIRSARLNLVDLAGSERVGQSGAIGQQLKEAQSINRSLSELGNVVNALRQRHQHIPFRNCQLTRLLEDCLNGDSKTLMIVQVAPGSSTIQDSISSLNFAEKVGRVQTSPFANAYQSSLSSARLLKAVNSSPMFVRSNSMRRSKKSYSQ